MSIIEKT